LHTMQLNFIISSTPKARYKYKKSRIHLSESGLSQPI